MRRASIRVLEDLSSVCDRGRRHAAGHPPGHIWGEEMRDAARALDRSLDDLATLQRGGRPARHREHGSVDICFFREPEFLGRLSALERFLDVGHAHVNGNLEAFLREGGAIHVHLHDNCGNRDAHLGCGEGSIDFSRVMPALPPGATKVIEPISFDQYERSLEYLRSLQAEQPLHRRAERAELL